jgi:FeS assembly SUF system protein
MSSLAIPLASIRRPANAGVMQMKQAVADEDLLQAIIAALRTVFDPEIPTNIYDLGLIYAIDRVGEREIAVKMTLTAPGCPVAGTLPGMAASAVEGVEGVDRCHVELVWDPPWTKDRMSEEAQLELGLL